MKKLIFLGLSTLALIGCSSNISNSQQLLGTWRCTIHYDDFNIRTVDNLRFSANGYLTNQGTVNYPIEKPIFVYVMQQNGRWELQNNKITYRVLSESVQRNHSAEIGSELQMDSELKQFEENLFSSLSEDAHHKKVELAIVSFSEQKMDIKQEMKGHKTYKGQCVKK